MYFIEKFLLKGLKLIVFMILSVQETANSYVVNLLKSRKQWCNCICKDQRMYISDLIRAAEIIMS